MKSLLKSTALFMALLMLFSTVALAAPDGAQTTVDEWAAEWENIKSDDSVIALTPGSDESQMNFAWLSALYDFKPQFKLSENSAMNNSVAIPVASSLTIVGKITNKVTATELRPGTEYYYSYTEKGLWSKPEAFKTGSGNNFKAILVADSQIGRSGDEKSDEVLFNDSFGWNATLEAAFDANPDIDFILSAGDQVETAGTNLQYNLFLAPSPLRNIPLATTMGNHDFYHPLYQYHFNNPNEFEDEVIQSPGGSGYWFTRGSALFIVLDSNIPAPVHQELLVKQAVEANPDAVWRIVLMHHSIYGASGEPTGANLWRFYAPVFDRFEIDLVLSGHDHRHCRSYPIKNNKIVADGEGVVYLCANSASGSKYSGVPETQPWYAANSSQLNAPAYTVLDFEKNMITINTYRADTMQTTDDEYVMHKQAPTGAVPVQSLLMRIFAAISTLIMVIKASL